MRFHLYYRGKLPSNGDSAVKNRIRAQIHPQLAALWKQKPLKGLAERFLDPKDEISVIRSVEGHNFAPLITSKHHLLARLSILFLRPEEPGNLVTQGGDIDNRIKTLLDALSVPQANQLPGEHSAEILHCLLEDDNLVTYLSVDVDRLLDGKSAQEVLLVIEVDVSATSGTFKNSVFTL